MIPNRDGLRFPWLGIWEHESAGTGELVLPPETIRYHMHDFLPLRWEDFLGVRVGVPNNSQAILDTYFATDDWMRYC